MHQVKAGQRPKRTARDRAQPLGAMPMGVRSGKAVCEGRKTAMVAAGTEHAWLPQVEAGSMIRLNFNGREPGWVVVEVATCCYHEVIAQIPQCANGHDLRAFGAEESWDEVLGKALFGGRDPVPPQVMLQRAARGWYVIDFSVAQLHRRWCVAMGIAEGGLS